MSSPKIIISALAACFALTSSPLHATPNKSSDSKPNTSIFKPSRQIKMTDEERIAELKRREHILSRTQILFNLLAAEIAYQQNNPTTTLGLYLHSLNESPTPEVAERAMELAIQLRAYQIAEQIYQKWREFEPEASPAQQRLTWARTLAMGDFKTALASLDDVLANANDEQKNRIFMMLAQMSVAQPELAQQGSSIIHRAALANPQLSSAAIADIFANVGKAGNERYAVDALQRLASQDQDIAPATLLTLQLLSQNHADVLTRFFDKTPSEKLATAWRELEVESLVHSKQYDRAEQKLNILLSDAPNARLYLQAAAIAMAKNPQSGLIAAYLDKAYQLGDAEQKAITALSAAMLLINQENQQESQATDAALVWLNKAPLHTPYDFDIHTVQAALYADKQQWQPAQQHLQQAQKANDASARFFDKAYVQRLSVHLTARKQPAPQAIAQLTRQLQQAQRQQPRDNDYVAEILYQRGLLYADKTQQNHLAIADLRQVLRLRPDNAEIQNSLGYTLLSENSSHWQEALRLIEAAHKQQPDNPAFTDSLGWAHYLLGDFDKAVGYLETAYRKDPQAEVGAHLGAAYWQVGAQDAARKVWHESWQKSPNDRVLQQILKQFNISFNPKP